MVKHWKSLIYLLQHKYWVYYFGRQLGLGHWQLIIHDLSKFLPCEWFAYANYFHSNHPDRQLLFKEDFLKAWEHHWQHNAHHWQYWWQSQMPSKYIREMIADWLSAGYCQKGRVELLEWYTQEKERIKMHWKTRAEVELLINWWYTNKFDEKYVPHTGN